MIWLISYFIIGLVLGGLAFAATCAADGGRADEAAKVGLAVCLFWAPALVLGLFYGLWVGSCQLISFLRDGQGGPGA